MRLQLSFAVRAALAAAVCAAATGCGTFDRASMGIASSIAPYKVEIVQGNFVSREQVALLQKGLSRTQVRDTLGTPLVSDAFHRDRWDYVFTIDRQGVPPQRHQLTVHFTGDTLDRWEGDTMPTEAEFVASLDNKRKGAKVPELQASDEKLRQFSAENKPPAAPAPQPPAPASPVSYPPLEPAR